MGCGNLESAVFCVAYQGRVLLGPRERPRQAPGGRQNRDSMRQGRKKAWKYD